MTLAQATRLLELGCAELSGERNVFDLGRVTGVDSSGLAVVFGWRRSAQSRRGDIRIVNPPEDLLSLADLYGVRELLPT